MAQSEISVNISQLPQIQQISPGNLLIVNTSNGTYTIDFANFIITPNNTTFYPMLSATTIAVASLSASTNSKLADLSAAVDAAYDKIYIGQANISINNGSSQSINLNPTPPTGITIATTDVVVTPSNAVAVLSGAYVSAVTGPMVTLTSPYLYTTAATFNLHVIKTY